MKLTGEQPIEGVVSDRVAIETAKDLSKDIVRVKRFDATDTKNDVPYLLLKQWFKYQETPISLVSTTVPTFTLLDPWIVCFGNTLELINKRYRYWRAGIRIMVKINSIPLDYGTFGLAWYPTQNLASTPFSILNSDARFFDISTGGVHEFVIPYSSIFDGYSIRSASELDTAPKPGLWLINWSCFTLANTFSSSISLECRWDDDFRGWGVSAYDGQSPADFLDLGEKNVLKAQGQMLVSPTTVNAVLNTASGAITTLSTLREAASAVSETYKVVEGGIKWSRENLEMAKSMGNDMAGIWEDANSIYRSVSQPLFDTVDENEHNAVDGSFRTAPTPYAGMTNMKHTPIENFSCTMTRIDTEGLGNEDRQHGLIQLMQIPCVSTFLVMAQGYSMEIPVAPFPGTGFGDNNNHTYGDTLVPDYLAQFSQFFRKWRGSIVYSFLIFTSPMITGGLDFIIDNLGSERWPGAVIPSPTPPYLYRKSVMVTGFTRVDICVPFIYNSRWCGMKAAYDVIEDDVPYHQPNIPSRLTVQCKYLTSSALGTGSTPKMFVVVIRSAGPDFQVCNFAGSEFDRIAPAVAQGQMRVRDKPPAFDNICGGVFPPHKLRPLPEDRMTLEDLLKRWSHRFSPTNNGVLTPFYARNMAGSRTSNAAQWYAITPLPDLFDYILGMFRYARGNIQFKIRTAVSVTGSGDVEWTMEGEPALSLGNPADNDAITAGTTRIVNSLNPVAEFEAPIESYQTEWLIMPPQFENLSSVPYELTIKTRLSAAQVVASGFFVRGGRALQLNFLSPPFSSWNSLYPTTQIL